MILPATADLIWNWECRAIPLMLYGSRMVTRALRKILLPGFRSRLMTQPRKQTRRLRTLSRQPLTRSLLRSWQTWLHRRLPHLHQLRTARLSQQPHLRNKHRPQLRMLIMLRQMQIKWRIMLMNLHLTPILRRRKQRTPQPKR